MMIEPLTGDPVRTVEAGVIEMDTGARVVIQRLVDVRDGLATVAVTVAEGWTSSALATAWVSPDEARTVAAALLEAADDTDADARGARSS